MLLRQNHICFLMPLSLGMGLDSYPIILQAIKDKFMKFLPSTA